MERNDPVEIVRVNNGFIVNFALGIGGPHRETHVFQTVEGMRDWLERHFGVEPVERDSIRVDDPYTPNFGSKVEPLTATEIERRKEEHRFETYRKRFEESARLRYLNAFGTDAMTEAEIRAAGG